MVVYTETKKNATRERKLYWDYIKLDAVVVVVAEGSYRRGVVTEALANVKSSYLASIFKEYFSVVQLPLL